MHKPWTILLFGCLLLCGAAVAEAGLFGLHCGRCLGLGWGDGYHARCDCGHGCGHGCVEHYGDFGGPAHGAACQKGHSNVKVKVVSPGCFGCGARIVPTYEPGPAYYP